MALILQSLMCLPYFTHYLQLFSHEGAGICLPRSDCRIAASELVQ